MITLFDALGCGFDITPEEGEALCYAIEHDTLRQSTLTTISETLYARLNGSKDDILVYDSVEQLGVYGTKTSIMEQIQHG